VVRSLLCWAEFRIFSLSFFGDVLVTNEFFIGRFDVRSLCLRLFASTSIRIRAKLRQVNKIHGINLRRTLKTQKFSFCKSSSFWTAISLKSTYNSNWVICKKFQLIQKFWVFHDSILFENIYYFLENKNICSIVIFYIISD
jgi:hypothetical protein